MKSGKACRSFDYVPIVWISRSSYSGYIRNCGMKNSCTVCRRGEIEAASSGSFCDAICDEALCQQHFVDFLVILWRAITFSSRQFLPYVENMCLSFFLSPTVAIGFIHRLFLLWLIDCFGQVWHKSLFDVKVFFLFRICLFLSSLVCEVFICMSSFRIYCMHWTIILTG